MRLTADRIDVVLGIDVGTQSCKCVALDADGSLLGVGQHGYDLLTPRPQWVEQDPAAWWKATVSAVRDALRQAEVSPARVRGIGVCGQMHGIVLLNTNLDPLRPAIIWMDRRSANLLDVVQNRIPPDDLVNVAANRLSPGFAAATLAWIYEVEPRLLDQTRAVIQPKDYVTLRLTGEVSSEPSDASATWLFDVPNRRWSDTLAQASGIALEKLPALSDSAAPVGELRPDVAQELGLPPHIPVVAGSSDQAALLMGVGVIEPGHGAITIATGGQITIVSNRPLIDPKLRLNTFCHAIPERWFTMGAILNGGIALRWWRDAANGSSYDEMIAKAASAPAGSDGLIFLPYLEGERTPIMDPNASGAFLGLTLRHTQAHMTRAVMEGVAFAFRDCLLALREVGPIPDHFVIGGGGAQSALWRQIMASALGVSVQTVAGREQTATGAALLAGVGSRVFYDLSQAVASVARYGITELPDRDEHALYVEQFGQFRAQYRALRDAR